MDLHQTLKQKKSFIRIATDQTESLIDQLEKEIMEMEDEYKLMDKPIKTIKPTTTLPQDIPIIIIEPPSPTPTIDKILLSLYDDN